MNSREYLSVVDTVEIVTIIYQGSLAQVVEHRIFNPVAAGSNPARPIIAKLQNVALLNIMPKCYRNIIAIDTAQSTSKMSIVDPKQHLMLK